MNFDHLRLEVHELVRASVEDDYADFSVHLDGKNVVVSQLVQLRLQHVVVQAEGLNVAVVKVSLLSRILDLFVLKHLAYVHVCLCPVQQLTNAQQALRRLHDLESRHDDVTG